MKERVGLGILLGILLGISLLGPASLGRAGEYHGEPLTVGETTTRQGTFCLEKAEAERVLDVAEKDGLVPSVDVFNLMGSCDVLTLEFTVVKPLRQVESQSDAGVINLTLVEVEAYGKTIYAITANEVLVGAGS